jgi:hypothetical protein
MKTSIRKLIYRITSPYLYYHISFFIKKRRLKKANNILFNDKDMKTEFDAFKENGDNEKLFIFGTGSSVNELTQDNFKEVNSGYSIGINKWIFHEFVVDCYLIELSNDLGENEKMRLQIIYLLDSKIKKPVFLIYNNQGVNSLIIKSFLRGMDTDRVILYEYMRPYIFNDNLKIEFINLLNFLSVRKKSGVTSLGLGSSVERAVSLGILYGYSEIILLGVDLKNTKYFWSDGKSIHKDIKSNQKDCGPHLTATKRFGAIPVQESLLLLDRVARAHFSSSILISTEMSLLSGKLKKYKWRVNV